MLILVVKQTCSPDGNYPKCFKLLVSLHEQFRWNIYIRYLMMAYLDFVFISGIVIFDPAYNVLTPSGIIAIFTMTFTVFVPWMILFYLCAKFD